MTKSCLSCGADISHRSHRAVNCVPCAYAVVLEQMRAYNLRQHHARLRQRATEGRGRGIEYLYQSNSKDGRYYKVFGALRVEKYCQSCHRADDEVRGQWGPIFTICDARGRESDPVLLCRDCYGAECDKGLRRAS